MADIEGDYFYLFHDETSRYVLSAVSFTLLGLAIRRIPSLIIRGNRVRDAALRDSVAAFSELSVASLKLTNKHVQWKDRKKCAKKAFPWRRYAVITSIGAPMLLLNFLPYFLQGATYTFNKNLGMEIDFEVSRDKGLTGSSSLPGMSTEIFGGQIVGKKPSMRLEMWQMCLSEEQFNERTRNCTDTVRYSNMVNPPKRVCYASPTGYTYYIGTVSSESPLGREGRNRYHVSAITDTRADAWCTCDSCIVETEIHMFLDGESFSRSREITVQSVADLAYVLASRPLGSTVVTRIHRMRIMKSTIAYEAYDRWYVVEVGITGDIIPDLMYVAIIVCAIPLLLVVKDRDGIAENTIGILLEHTGEESWRSMTTVGTGSDAVADSLFVSREGQGHIGSRPAGYFQATDFRDALEIV